MTMIIAAVDRDGGFGLNGKIPWRFSEDFKHFKEKTHGKVCVMGRITYEDMFEMTSRTSKGITDSILPNRTCYVLSSSNLNPIGATHASSVAEVQTLHPKEDIVILGGATLFEQNIDLVDHIWLTAIDGIYNCDRFFPTDRLDNFKITEGTKLITSTGDTLYFVHYVRNATQ